MRVKIKGLCRGAGTIYVLLEATIKQPENLPDIKVVSDDGMSLPAEVYNLDSLENIAMSQIVVATPMLATSSIRILAEATDSFGKTRIIFHRKLRRSHIKWLSRFNYRLMNEKMHQIRDTDRKTYSRQIHINPLSVTYAQSPKKEMILKGIVCTPLDEKEPSIRMIDGNGKPTDVASVIFGTTTTTLSLGVRRLETSFTVRLPQDEFTYCLVAESNNSNRSGFLCLDPLSKQRLSAAGPHFYTVSSPDSYSRWARIQDSVSSAYSEHDYHFENPPKFSIITPLYKTPPYFFRAMVQSVLVQDYSNWELILVNASPDDPNLSNELARLDDPRIRIITMERNLGIAENTNRGILAATGDYIALFDHDDVLAKNALKEYAVSVRNNPDALAFYCDEDFLNENERRLAPHFKSDFNLDLLRCHNYITHFLVVKAKPMQELLLNKEYDGAQDYDLVLRLAEISQNIVHIPKVLYHWRIHSGSTAASADNKNYADDAGRRALADHLKRLGLPATVSLTENPCFYHVEYDLTSTPLVSIIIPNKDNVSVLKRCIASILNKTSYQNYEIIIVENNSAEEETFEYYKTVEADDRIRVLFWNSAFNYSAINNFGAEAARGSYLLLLNNDTEIIEQNWLSSMLSFCQRSDVGVVGAKLLYPDDTVQHAGVIMIKCNSPLEMGGPIHIFSNLDKNDSGYMRRASLVQDLSAVTGACLMTKKDVFERVNGLDTDFAVAFNDVDYCLKVRELGLYVVYDPEALLYHYESLSRGSDDEKSENYTRFLSEQGLLKSRWSKYYASGDPYHGQFSTLSI
ncbi:glycosyltransferase family 2 protein [Adlercreutzia sp. ZJ138]|uniref:glycosyltransferase family 2 protein n=1 Tax=Adlercreutzia sp. ZJ138 TaxID=2709405 RepID=UPI0013EE0837|nr:glycosyltransferase family 2 protein [Adlercreutzia sp. ZJ138]